ncbi:hypothetical protein BS50DRAFT_446482, partial [Corynespora cassiicola Philippines]
ASSASGAYTLNKTYDATNFFSSFDFQDSTDIWSYGNTSYLSVSEAQKKGLVKNDSDRIFLGADAVTTGGEWRDSVRLESKEVLSRGLLIADFEHIPGQACGVWPAFWLVHDSYLEFAEIDIIEGISTSTHNELSIHTNNPSCTVGSGQASGQIIGVNQVVESNGNIAKSGVRVANAFGRAFNEHGGGTYAMQLEFGGISIWYFPHGTEPGDIASEKPTPAKWPSPVMRFVPAQCDILAVWKEMRIVLNINFCGSYAGSCWVDGCGSTCKALTGVSTCGEYVLNNPTAFKEAFFLIRSIKLYQGGG